MLTKTRDECGQSKIFLLQPWRLMLLEVLIWSRSALHDPAKLIAFDFSDRGSTWFYSPCFLSDQLSLVLSRIYPDIQNY